MFKNVESLENRIEQLDNETDAATLALAVLLIRNVCGVLSAEVVIDEQRTTVLNALKTLSEKIGDVSESLNDRRIISKDDDKEFAAIVSSAASLYRNLCDLNGPAVERVLVCLNGLY